MPQLTAAQKRDFAKQLYLSDPSITQAEIADRVGVSKQTISKWVNDNKWDAMRKSLIMNKELQLSMLYDQLNALNLDIKSRPQPYANSKEADAINKLTASINKLETETNIADKIEVGKEFLQFVKRTASLDKAKELSCLFDAYVKSCIK